MTRDKESVPVTKMLPFDMWIEPDELELAKGRPFSFSLVPSIPFDNPSLSLTLTSRSWWMYEVWVITNILNH